MGLNDPIDILLKKRSKWDFHTSNLRQSSIMDSKQQTMEYNNLISSEPWMDQIKHCRYLFFLYCFMDISPLNRSLYLSKVLDLTLNKLTVGIR